MSGRIQRMETVAALRAHLAEVCPGSGAPDTHRHFEGRLGTGIAGLDDLLGGGFERGRLTALSGSPGSGLTSLLRPGIFRALAAGERVGLVDGEGTLYPPDWITPRGEVWVMRALSQREALWAAELMASCGAFALVAVSPASRAIDGRWGARLRRAAREGGAALVVLGATSSSALGAAWGLRITPLGLDTEAGRWVVRVQRTRGGPPAREEVSFDVQDRLYPCRLPPAPVVPDRRPAPGRPRREGFAEATGGAGPRPGEPRAAEPRGARRARHGPDPGDEPQPGPSPGGERPADPVGRLG